MKRILSFFLLVLMTSAISFAQDVDFDKSSGITKVDGKESFKVLKANQLNFAQFDVSVESLTGEKLIYLTLKNDREKWNSTTRKYETDPYFIMHFLKSNKVCEFEDFTINVTKSIAKVVAKTGLVKDGKIDPQAENVYIEAHNGWVYEKEDKTINLKVETPPTSAANQAVPIDKADIVAKDGKIYYKSELVGTFKESTAAGLHSIKVYDANAEAVANASAKEDGTGDWEIKIAATDKNNTILYNKSTASVDLFKYLLSKGILKAN